MRKGITSIFLAVVLFCSAIFTPPLSASAAYQPDSDIYSKTAYMVNTDSGTVVYAKNENQKMYPASLTKIIVCMMVLETETDMIRETHCEIIAIAGIHEPLHLVDGTP